MFKLINHTCNSAQNMWITHFIQAKNEVKLAYTKSVSGI
jgi:hypothetical protein